MKRVLRGLTTILFVSCLLVGCLGESKQIAVTTTAVKSGDKLSGMAWQGSIAAASSIDVMPNGTGKITAIPVKESDHVEAGEVLFQVDNQNAWLQLEQAKANYQAVEAAFVNAEKTSQQNTSVRPAEIAYSTSKDNFSRIQALYSSGAVSQADYEEAKAQMDSASAQLQAARNGQTGNYDVTKAQLESAKAAIDIVQKQYDDCMVTSPITGMVTNVYIEIGQMVSPQVKAITIIDDSGKKVEIQVADIDIDQIQVGMSMDIQIQPLGVSCLGNVSELSAVSDTATGMFTVKILLDDGAEIRYIGLPADVRISNDHQSNSVYVPEKCLQSDENGNFVYKILEDKVVKIDVTKGKKKNSYYEVAGELAIGDEVVLQSSKPLEDQLKVKVLTTK